MKCETKVIKSARAGRFRISLLELTKTTMVKDEWLRDFVPEPTRTTHRIALQYSRKVNGQWQNETIYCSLGDFRNLQNAIDEFTDAEDGDEKSPSLTPEVVADEN